MIFCARTFSFTAAIFLMLFTRTLSDTLPACSVIQGLPGLNGRDGRDGINGLKGDTGPPGVVGAPAMRGSTGPPGKQGPKGDLGLTALLTNIQNKLSSLEAQVNQMQLITSARTKALLFARGAIAGEKIFVTSGKQLTYDETKAICLKAGGQLATPRNSEENNAILNIAQNYNLFPFLGITDIQTEGTFRYSDGNSITYSNWNIREPNQKGEEDCVEMQLDGKWNDRRCEEKRLNVCEF
ncbi:pulmonary surfactant-associated protein A-like isoform X1 [Bufo gargarizans]|uniref:pulmonary surfactant-associated protein A-like isoform X1 n=1 Tax=Bufo gargarizans TaxID=30331 RepID=UPI001CF4C737|nr:pulmonary surfactant-associated protein A-like isoform X1 [Bufo gargarizans]XP_044131107.1 pulmonary surfactant-associated protein A-like isoform X1 [Bufo gargarizans]XP_044131109.1 pulmonary surfactant-associated protein A-like isoform X1 [Bufo gargarizans]